MKEKSFLKEKKTDADKNSLWSLLHSIANTRISSNQCLPLWAH